LETHGRNVCDVCPVDEKECGKLLDWNKEQVHNSLRPTVKEDNE